MKKEILQNKLLFIVANFLHSIMNMKGKSHEKRNSTK